MLERIIRAAVIATLLPAAPAAAQERGAEDVSLETLLNLRVSSAARYLQTAREAPASVTVITSEDLDRFGHRTLDEVLETVPGLYLNNDLESTSLGVRGFGRPGDYNSRVLILIDGQTINESASGAAFLDSRLGTNLDLVERVEIVRGPGSALYGTGAMLAVVNVVTKDAAHLEGIRIAARAGDVGFREGDLTAGTGFGRKSGIVGSVTWGLRGGETIYFRDLDFEQYDHGLAERRDWKEYLGGSLESRIGDLRARASLVSHRAGDPVSSIQTAFNHEDARTHFEIARLEAEYERPLGTRRRIAVRGHLNRLGRSTTSPMLSAAGVTLVDDRAESIWSGGEIQYRWDTSPSNRLIAGAEYRNARIDYEQWAGSETLGIADFNYHIVSGFLQDELQLRRDLAVTGGLRYDHYSQTGYAITPRLALVYSPLRTTTVKLLYGRAFRAPSVIELNWEEPEVNFLPNPDLKPEFVHTIELALERQIHRDAVLSASLYRYDMHDLIDLTLSDDQIIQYRNVGHVRARGLETSVRARTECGIFGYAGYSLQRVRHADGDRSVANSPEHLVKAGASMPLFDLLRAGATFRYESERYTVFRTRTAAYWLMDLTIQTRTLLEHVRVTTRVKNVFDVRYELPGTANTRQLGIPQYGRRLSFEIQYAL